MSQEGEKKKMSKEGEKKKMSKPKDGEKEKSEKKRKRNDDSPINNDLYSILGNIYTKHHSYSQPTVYQVIGWTKHSEKPDSKRKSIFARRVKFLANNHRHGGDGVIDRNDVQNITEPVYQGIDGAAKFTLQTFEDVINGERYFLQKRSNYGVERFYVLRDLDQGYMWCDY